jgi:hypothetical protein
MNIDDLRLLLDVARLGGFAQAARARNADPSAVSRAVAALESEMPVAMLAAEIGYFDQSRLTVDVARYAGATPGRLISESVSDFSKTRCDVPF